jgi:hypothetical protein
VWQVKRISKRFSTLSFGFIGAVVIFVDIPAKQKIAAGIACILVLFVGYLWLWFRAKWLREINLTIEESTVVIKTGISAGRV